MKKRFLFFCLAIFSISFTTPATAEEIGIGDAMPNLCWPNESGQNVCLHDFAGKIKVLLFNAGWCGPCNSHMTTLANRVSQYQSKPVVFISLSVSGWNHGSGANADFLKEWKTKHKITFATLAAGQNDMEQIFPPPHYIPSDAVVDADNKLVFRDVGPSVEVLFSEVDKNMPEEDPVVILPFPEP